MVCLKSGAVRKKKSVVWVCGVVKSKKLWLATSPLPPAVLQATAVVAPGVSEPVPVLESTEVATPSRPVVADNNVLANPTIADEAPVTAPVTIATVPSAPPVAPTSFKVGDKGPGGGTVFYVASSSFTSAAPCGTTCKYLEVAPNTWSGDTADPQKTWAVSGHQSSDLTSIANDSLNDFKNPSGIGLGYQNSQAIIINNDNIAMAAGAARAYDGGSQSDWYLPTMAELNLLCQWARNVVQDVTTECKGGILNTGTGINGGFSGLYWSSSEVGEETAGFQDFNPGNQGYSGKMNRYRVRPVRAFSPTTPSAPVTIATIPSTPAVGAALTPVFETPEATADGFTVQISNYDSSYTWAGTATASGKVSINNTGLVTVTGVADGTSSTATITNIKRNTVGGTNTVMATSLLVMSMVTVDNAGNAADTKTGSVYGAVSYSYQIGAYDVTGSQYTAFLNAVASTDTYGLYNKGAQISRSGTHGTYTYAIENGTGQRPITHVSWFDCARFANWMSNGQPRGGQTSTTTENGAYNVNGATTGNAVQKNATNPNTGSAPRFRIPTENEWYKAAYYSPNYGGTDVGGYYTYAMQSDNEPGTIIGSGANQANYKDAIGSTTDVGAFSGSGSFYGTFDQSGNVYQWTDGDGQYFSSRLLRGGYYVDSSYNVSSSSRVNHPLSDELSLSGFRLAS